jgi:hypothetical protein
VQRLAPIRSHQQSNSFPAKKVWSFSRLLFALRPQIQILFRGRRLERLSSLALSRHDTDKHYGQTVKKATRNAMMAEYHLPPSEQLLMSCDAKNVVEVKDAFTSPEFLPWFQSEDDLGFRVPE